MCTILIWKDYFEHYPLVLAANRDEFYRRPTHPPALLQRDPPLLAGLDLKGQGTWMGATASGFFAGLTNQRTYRKADPTLLSRGEVVLETLRQNHTTQAMDYLSTLHPSQYNPFNLLFGTATDLRLAYARPDQSRLHFEEVPSGFHVLPNDQLDSPRFTKVHRAYQLHQLPPASSWDELAHQLPQLLADHRLPPLEQIPSPPSYSCMPRRILHRLEALCIHLPLYGTRSATLVALHPQQTTHYLYADGPPCNTPFRELTHLLPCHPSPP